MYVYKTTQLCKSFNSLKSKQVFKKTQNIHIYRYIKSRNYIYLSTA